MRGTGTDVGYRLETGKGLLNVMNKAVCRDGDIDRDKNREMTKTETLLRWRHWQRHKL